MRNLWQKIISLVLVLTLVTPTTTIAFASERNADETQQYLQEFAENDIISSKEFSLINTEMSSSEINSLMEDVYSDLSNESRQILEEYMSLYDPDMLLYYEEVTDTVVENSKSFVLNDNLNRQDVLSISERAVAVSAMQDLSNSLRYQNLPQEVYNFLMTVGANLVAIAGTITVSQVVAALAVVGGAVLLYNNWDKISSKWGSITAAFAKSIAKSSASTGAINTGFAKKKTECTTIQQDMARGRSVLRSVSYTPSADKHVEQASITNIIRGNDPTEMYYSSMNRTMLIVIKISSGYKATFFTNMKGDHVYDLVDYNVSGFKMYLLVDPVKGKIFHCHLRKSVNDIEQFRKANQLDWRLKPLPVALDTKYTNSNGSGYFTGNQID